MTEGIRKYWPSGLTALVMKAAFHTDLGVAQHAWQVWQELCDFDNSLWGDVRIASVAYRRLGGASAAKNLEPRLAGLRRYIWSTGMMRLHSALPLLQRYAEQELTFAPIKGAVLLAHNQQALNDRFIADVDVLVDHANWEKAIDLALQDGWHAEKGITRDTAVHRMWQTHHSLSLLKGAKGAIDLHYFSLRLNRQRGADAMIWKRAVPGKLGELPVTLPHPSDHLAITVGHCFLYANPKSHDWVCDALTTIAMPGFDWNIFADAVIDRELAAPAITALTYLADELQIPVPAHERQRLLAHAREPFLGELAAYSRTYQNRNEAEARAIYLAEGIRSRKSLQRVPPDPDTGARETTTRAELADVPLGKKVALPLPRNVGRDQSIDYRLVLKIRGLPWPTRVLVVLGCLDGVPLEINRWRLQGRWGLRQTLKGQIDGALINGRGIDALWVKVSRKAQRSIRVSGFFETRIVDG
jgi:putative nucleotidyltransferase-like protein